MQHSVRGFAAALAAAVMLAPGVQAEEEAGKMPEPEQSGFATAEDGLQIHYEIFGTGEPIVLMPGGLMDIPTLSEIIRPLSRTRQVIAVEPEGHGKTGLRDTPMAFDRLGDDVVAVLRHLGIDRADVGGYSHGADIAINVAARHPERVRNLVVISTAMAWDGWYPEAQAGMQAVGGDMAEGLKQTPIYDRYGDPGRLPEFLDRMGALMRGPLDMRDAVAALPGPVLLIFADHDSVSMAHIAEFFAALGGGVREPGWVDTKFSRGRLAIVPGYSHYNLGQAPEVAAIIERFLTQPTSTATQFAP